MVESKDNYFAFSAGITCPDLIFLLVSITSQDKNRIIKGNASEMFTPTPVAPRKSDCTRSRRLMDGIRYRVKTHADAIRIPVVSFQPAITVTRRPRVKYQGRI